MERRADSSDLELEQKAATSSAEWLPATVGVAGAGAVAIWCGFDAMRLMSLQVLLALALKYLVFACGVCALLFFAVRKLLSGPAPLCLRHSLAGAMLISAWLPALALYLDRESVWMLLPAMVIPAIWLRASRAHAETVHGPADVPTHVRPHIATLTSTRALVWSPAPGHSFTISLLVQTAITLAAAGAAFWAVPFAGLASALAAANSQPLLASHPQPCTSLRGYSRLIAVMLVAAFLVTVHGLLPHLRRWGLPAGEASQDQLQIPIRRNAGATARPDEKIHTGVIILPPEQPRTLLVPPMPALGPVFGTKDVTQDPLRIPFYGQYWIYRPPDRRPPNNSAIIHGTPAARRMVSTDHGPLRMEARQSLGAFFSVDCCSAIEVVVANADRYQGTLALELLLGSSGNGPAVRQSLGSVRLPSAGRQRYVEPVQQHLEFALPRTSSVRQFNELFVVFHLDPMRANEAARVGVQGFTMVPKVY
ncbi:MAG TPA: hypothetical protein VES20_25685 [Bryobacteraceae bacterium]|nr:hypothetical protein [Bryobacteraceae bacterium]